MNAPSTDAEIYFFSDCFDPTGCLLQEEIKSIDFLTGGLCFVA